MRSWLGPGGGRSGSMVGNNLVINFRPILLALPHGSLKDRIIIFFMGSSIFYFSAANRCPDEQVGTKVGHCPVAKVM